MQSTITGRHIEVTPALKDHVNNKLARLERHHEPPASMQVILAVEKRNHKAEGIMNIAGKPVCAKAVKSDMYTAIDALMDKLDRQLIRQKEQRTQRRATPVSRLSDDAFREGEQQRA